MIPEVLQPAILTELHEGHPGIVRAKAVARSLVWWPGIDKAIEGSVKACADCMLSPHKPAKAPLHPWVFPDHPWSRLHINYAGPIMGKMILVIVDAYTKWIDVHVSSGSTSTITISALRNCFSTHGLPDVIVSDSATCFTSDEFKHFCHMNGIHHITSAPHHPSSNGMAERAVEVIKEGLKRMEDGDLRTKLNRFLFHYRVTPHSTTGIAPAELLMGRQLKTRMHLVSPNLRAKVELQQHRQKQYHNQHSQVRGFHPSDPVYALVYHRNQATWTPGTIDQKTGPISYMVHLATGQLVRRRIDQLQARIAGSMAPTASPSLEPPVPVPVPMPLPTATTESSVATQWSRPRHSHHLSWYLLWLLLQSLAPVCLQNLGTMRLHLFCAALGVKVNPQDALFVICDLMHINTSVLCDALWWLMSNYNFPAMSYYEGILWTFICSAPISSMNISLKS